MKKIFPLVALLSAMALVGCGTESSASTPASEPAASTKSEAPKSSTESKASEAPKSSAPAASTPAAHAHTWTAGAATTNADSKNLANATCTCGAAKVEIAITDASSGATDIGEDGKLGKEKSFTWKFVAPKAGNATLQFCVKYGQPADKMSDDVRNTIWGNGQKGNGNYEVKNGETAATVLISGKTYAETGVTEEGAYIDFATMAVTAGENVISLTTPSDQYYRNCFINNVALIIA